MTAPDAAHEARERAELLPCPFCGGSEIELAQTSHFWIMCECGVEGPSSKTEDGATTAWNHRAFAAAMQAREARIAELEAALKPFSEPTMVGVILKPTLSPAVDDNILVYEQRWFDNARTALATASQSEPTP